MDLELKGPEGGRRPASQCLWDGQAARARMARRNGRPTDSARPREQTRPAPPAGARGAMTLEQADATAAPPGHAAKTLDRT